MEYHYAWENEQLILTTPAYDRPVVIDWVFGSGTHARTPVMTSPTADGGTQAIEHAVSCYPTGLGPTVGQEGLTATSGLTAIGQDRPPHEAINCFGCHSTHVATDGDRILFERIQPGVGCQRCHWNSDQHAAAMERGESEVLLEDWTTMTPAESVDRCGECHRRADEMEGPIEPTDPLLPRFASVGLVQSRCFTEQASLNSAVGPALRLDCLTCHDPHAPHESRAEVSRQACANCHDAKRGRATECPTSPRDADCLRCHMPAVPANDQLRFTDHWIRVGDVARKLASETDNQKSPPPKSPPPKSPPP